MPHINLWEPCYFAKVPDGLQTYSVKFPLAPKRRSPDMHVWVKPKLHTQRIWAEVSSSTPHLLQSGLSSSPSRWRYLLRVLSPVKKPVTALDWVLLKDRNLALAPRQCPRISSRACLWVSPRPCHRTQCWLTNQRLILLHISCLDTARAGSGPRNPRTEPPLGSS